MGSIFLSHNREDKDFARRLADDLRRAGIKVWLDEAEIHLGDSIIGKIEEGLLGSDFLGVILSPSSVASRWVKEELRSAMHYQLTKSNKVVLPLLYRECDVPAFLVDKLYADFTRPENYEVVLRQLLSRLDPSFVPPTFVSRADLQRLLDRLPTPPNRPLFQNRVEDDVEFVTDNAIDVSELNATMAWPAPKLFSALRELIKAQKAELFLLRIKISGGHPDIPSESPGVLPLVFKGLLPPQLRASPEDVEKMLRLLEKN